MNSFLKKCGIKGNEADKMMRQATDAAMTSQIAAQMRCLQNGIKKRKGKSYPVGELTAAEILAAIGELMNKQAGEIA